MTWLLWSAIGIQFVLIVLLMAAIGHLKRMTDRLWEALVGSSKVTDQNFVFIAERLATVATIVSVALKNDDVAQGIDLQKVSTGKLPN